MANFFSCSFYKSLVPHFQLARYPRGPTFQHFKSTPFRRGHFCTWYMLRSSNNSHVLTPAGLFFCFLIWRGCVLPSFFFLFFFCSLLSLSSQLPFSTLSLPRCNSDPGSRSRLFSPLPPIRHATSFLTREDFQPFPPSSTRIELPRSFSVTAPEFRTFLQIAAADFLITTLFAVRYLVCCMI